MRLRLPLLLILVIALTACTHGEDTATAVWQPPPGDYIPAVTPTATIFATPRYKPGTPFPTPTPDAPHPLPTLRAQQTDYTVALGDTLALLARRFNVSVSAIIAANQLDNPNILTVGTTLVIPAPRPAAQAPAFKVIPNSELVASPTSATFDVAAFVARQPGLLATYTEEVDGRTLSGAQLVARVARDYSVNPRLLLALLEYRSGWLTQREVSAQARQFPLGWHDPRRAGLWRQLHWAANELNRGYYLWRVGGLAAFVLADGQIVRPNPTVNAGTAAVQHLFALLDGLEDWQRDVSPQGFMRTYEALFGYPFNYALEPLLPPDLRQPPMQLPFEPGVTWYFTGGPHSAWGDGAAWGALDFAPGDVPPATPCAVSPKWVTAVAHGLVVRSEDGVVVLDLDGDGYEQTGWDVLYLHIAAEGRVPRGVYLHAGERIGHPSCEGGLANATHVHIARKYNGEWIPADRELPWVLDGWVSQGAGKAYDGYMRRGKEVKEACECRSAKNAILR